MLFWRTARLCNRVSGSWSSEPPAGSGGTLQVWAQIEVGLSNGKTVGPIPYFIEAERQGPGQMNFSASWEVIQLERAPDIDPSKTTFTLIATQWAK